MVKLSPGKNFQLYDTTYTRNVKYNLNSMSGPVQRSFDYIISQ